MLGRSTFAALILAAATGSGALAGEATLGDVSVALPPPPGFCELSASDPRDSRIITIISGFLEKSGNQLLGMSADCGQLADARAGRRQELDDVAQYQTQIATMNRPPAKSVAQVCDTLRAQGNKFLANQLVDLKARAESIVEKIRINETSVLGVLAEDTNACYTGLIQKVRTEAGTEKTQVAMGAVTVTRNRSVLVYRLTVYQNPDTVDAVLAKLKDDVAALIAANP